MGALFDGFLAKGAVVNLGFGSCEGIGSSLEPLGGFEDDPKIALISDAVKILLQGLGEDSNREGLKKTPLRVAKALREGTRGYRENVKDIVEGALFPEAGLDGVLGHAGGAGGLVVVRDLDLFSYCESCLLPFKVQCHVGYVPSGQRVVGLSKLSRVADVFTKRLQDPQRLAHQVCSALHDSIKPAGVAVALCCWHIQFPPEESSGSNSNTTSQVVDMRGWLPVSVCSGSGLFENRNSNAWSDFLALSKFRFTNREMTANNCWCPSRSQEMVSLCNGHGLRNHSVKNSDAAQPAMIAAVASIIRSLGEDPSRKELQRTPHQFVQWLMNFKKTAKSEAKPNGFDNGGLGLMKRTGDGCCGGNGMCYELDIPFCSQCEHHLLPFYGVVHIACLCSKEEGCTVERTGLQSIVGFHGLKLQVQERLTRQIAETVCHVFGCKGIIVVVEASHICMMSRGIEKVGSSTATIAVLGAFTSDPAAKTVFLQIVSECSSSSPCFGV